MKMRTNKPSIGPAVLEAAIAIQIFITIIWIQHDKCIQMSTNKPSIGPVVLEVALQSFEKTILNSNFPNL